MSTFSLNIANILNLIYFNFILFFKQVERLKEKVRHLESIVQNQEKQLNELESENSRLVKELDQREIQWEQREAELECAIEKNTISNVCGQTVFLCSVVLAFLTLRNILILIMWLQLTNDPLNNKNIHFVSELDLFNFIKKIQVEGRFLYPQEST